MKSAASDSSGTLRIAGVWPPAIRLGGQLCMVLAGVAPQLGQDRLKNAVDETLGLYKHVIREAILVLLGINSATGLAAIFIDKDKTDKQGSTKFLKDIISDGEGNAQLQRIQVVIWTCILAIIFVWNLFANFIFVEFDAYLLLLMGIANLTYLGSKPLEKPAKT
jgi:hypothetical protein